jgi:RNA polymerase sigma-70 factor (ECF subfamily)
MSSDSQDFVAVYDEHVWDVYGFLGYRLSSREEVEDLVQSTFERALRAWGRFDPERASARTWLLAIAQNLLIDHYRRGARGAEEPLPEGEPGEAQLGTYDDYEVHLGLDPKLEAALDELNERERELIALRFGGDLNGPEIADLTGLSLANVQQILSRSLRRMRATMSADERTPVQDRA